MGPPGEKGVNGTIGDEGPIVSHGVPKSKTFKHTTLITLCLRDRREIGDLQGPLASREQRE